MSSAACRRIFRWGWLALFWGTAAGLRAEWLLARVESVNAAAGAATFQFLESAEGRTGSSLEAQVAAAEVGWLSGRQGACVLARERWIAGERWWGGLWPVADPATLRSPIEALPESWRDWRVWTLDGAGTALGKRVSGGAVLYFLPLASPSESWVETELDAALDWLSTLRETIPELAGIRLLAISTRPEDDSWNALADWRAERPERTALDLATFGPQPGKLVRRRLSIPDFGQVGEEPLSLPLVYVIDRRGVLRERWQGWSPPFVHWEKLLRDAPGEGGGG